MMGIIRKTLTALVGLAAACLVLVLMPGEAKAADGDLRVGGEPVLLDFVAQSLPDSVDSITKTGDYDYTLTMKPNQTIAPASGTGGIIAEGMNLTVKHSGLTINAIAAKGIYSDAGNLIIDGDYRTTLKVTTTGNNSAILNSADYGTSDLEIIGGAVDIDMQNGRGQVYGIRSYGKLTISSGERIDINMVDGDYVYGISSENDIMITDGEINITISGPPAVSGFSGPTGIDVYSGDMTILGAEVNISLLDTTSGTDGISLQSGDLSIEFGASVNVEVVTTGATSDGVAVTGSIYVETNFGSELEINTNTITRALYFGSVSADAGAIVRAGTYPGTVVGNGTSGLTSRSVSYVYIGPAPSGKLTVNNVVIVQNSAETAAEKPTGVTYNALNNTLTLNGYTGGAILADDMDLNIVLAPSSNNTITYGADITAVGIDAADNNKVTISGSGTLNINHQRTTGTNYAIFGARGGVDIQGGTINIDLANGSGANNYNYGIGANSTAPVTINANSAVLTIDASGAATHSAALLGSPVSVTGSSATFREGDSATGATVPSLTLNTFETWQHSSKPYVYIGPAVPSGNLWVNGVAYVTGGAEAVGTVNSIPAAQYDHATKTLTLDGYDLGAIVAEGMDLKIQVDGASTVRNTLTTPPFKVEGGSLEITGGYLLTLINSQTTGDNYGIYAEGDVTIDGGKVAISTAGSPVFQTGICGVNVNIEGSTVYIQTGAGGSNGIETRNAGGVSLINSDIDIILGSGGITGIYCQNDATISGGDVDITIAAGGLGGFSAIGINIGAADKTLYIRNGALVNIGVNKTGNERGISFGSNGTIAIDMAGGTELVVSVAADIDAALWCKPVDGVSITGDALIKEGNDAGSAQTVDAVTISGGGVSKAYVYIGPPGPPPVILTGGNIYVGAVSIMQNGTEVNTFEYVYSDGLYIADDVINLLNIEPEYKALLLDLAPDTTLNSILLAEGAYETSNDSLVDTTAAGNLSNWTNIVYLVRNILQLPVAGAPAYDTGTDVTATIAIDNTASWNVVSKALEDYDGDATGIKYKVYRAEATAYTFPAGASITVDGGTDILTDPDFTVGVGGGTAEYDPATNTLTLTGYQGGPIKTEGLGLNIVLAGNNTVTYNEVGSVILIDGPLKISGGGTLNIVHAGHVGGVSGISANGDVNIDSGTVNLNIGGSTSMTCNGIIATGDAISINAGNGANLTINLEGGDSGTWALSCDELNVIGSAIQKEGETEEAAEEVDKVTFGDIGDHEGPFYLSIISLEEPDPDPDPDPARPGQAADKDKDKDKTPKKDTPTPIVAVLYDVQKTGDTFAFKVIVTNAKTNMIGKTVTVQMNESRSTIVTIGEDGVGHGTIEAPGYSWNIVTFSTRPNVPNGANVSSSYDIYSTGKLVRR